MAARDLGPWEYTCDNGTTVFVRRADKFITGQLVGGSGPGSIVGGQSGASTNPYNAMPRNFRPRALYCSGAGGVRATVVIYDKATYDAALATPITLNVRDGGGTSHSVTSYDGRPERRGRPIGRGQ